jgi:hypothetical protein
MQLVGPWSTSEGYPRVAPRLGARVDQAGPPQLGGALTGVDAHDDVLVEAREAEAQLAAGLGGAGTRVALRTTAAEVA